MSRSSDTRDRTFASFCQPVEDLASATGMPAGAGRGGLGHPEALARRRPIVAGGFTGLSVRTEHAVLQWPVEAFARRVSSGFHRRPDGRCSGHRQRPQPWTAA